MLSKTVCKSCQNKWKKSWKKSGDGPYTSLSDACASEICFYDWRERTTIRATVPEWCAYQLEHLVETQVCGE